MNLKICLLPAILLGLLLIDTARSQEIDVANQSVIAFDIQVSRIRASELAQKLGLEQLIDEQQRETGMDEIEITKIDRIIGSVSAPPDLASLDGMGDGRDLPLQFFVRVIFNDVSGAQRLYDKFLPKSTVEEINGRTYLRPKGNDPKNISICRLDDKTMEMGTDGYVMANTRNFRTVRLTETWNTMPNHAIRVAVDLESVDTQVQQAVSVAIQQLPREAMVMLSLVTKVSSASMTIDVTESPMIMVNMTGNDEAAAESLQTSLNGLLGMAQAGGQQFVDAMSQSEPAVAKVASAILSDLQVEKKGVSVNLAISRPEGLEEAIAFAMKQAKGAAEIAKGKNDLKQLAIAIITHHDIHRRFPWQAAEGQSNDLSWRARVLPVLEQRNLYREMDMDKGHDEAPNSQFASRMPSLFGEDGEHAMIYAVTHDPMPSRFADIIDGMSNTIMLIQMDAGIPWLENKDLTMDQVIGLVQALPPGQTINVAFYDGSVQSLDSNVPIEKLRALLTYNGKEIIQW